MRYYLLQKGNEFVIYRVKYAYVCAFLDAYEKEVLLASDGLVDLLIAFEREWMIGLEWPLEVK